MPLDLNELTARICPAEARRDIVRERIKGWTKKWLLRGSTPGRGGVRKWHHRMILDAALLDVLVEHGLQPAEWDLRPAFYVLRDAASAWASGDTDSQHWLQLFFQSRQSRPGWVVALPLIGKSGQQPDLNWPTDEEATFIISLTSILKRLQWTAADQEAVEADSKRRKII